jgi:Protein of unknown function (DUF4235)
MADKHGNIRSRIAGELAAAAAGIVARKVITLAWTRITGKVPPDDPHDPRVGLREAVGFTVVMGVGMELTRLLAMRATVKGFAPGPAEHTE